ncbi:hypothetical protein [uncultured Prevotella sp.]|uniref:hypothetical protein n=1 Tax=uncultured Prevotella sp. TaxID=159272 RepID=UPI0026257285|nr:hypothetical protein [uncultured Prevotella sp.]
MPINRLSGMFFYISCHRVIVFISSGLRIRHGDSGDEGDEGGDGGGKEGVSVGKTEKDSKKNINCFVSSKRKCTFAFGFQEQEERGVAQLV